MPGSFVLVNQLINHRARFSERWILRHQIMCTDLLTGERFQRFIIIERGVMQDEKAYSLVLRR